MPAPIINTEKLTRVYRVGDIEVQALRGVNLTIERGESVAIMGASGSGKSTLMAILGCLDRPTSGAYFFDGVDVARLAEPGRSPTRTSYPLSCRFCACACPCEPNPSTAIFASRSAPGSVSASW